MMLNTKGIVKQCCKCFWYKELIFFNKDSSRKDGFNPRCRGCYSTAKKIFYYENRERILLDKKNTYYEDLEKSRSLSRKSADKNKAKIIKRTKEARIREPERFIGYKLKQQFGITLEQYNQLLFIQNNKCAICNNEEQIIDKRTGKKRRLSVDHNHMTGKVRGLLCGRCNLGLGNFKDDKHVIKNGILYLSKTLSIEENINPIEATNIFNKIYSNLNLGYKDYDLSRHFGLTINSIKEIYIIQGAKCKICRKENKNNYKSLAVDHDHNSGEIRGLLCENCNTALGKFHDDVIVLENAIKYLEKNNEEQL